MNITGLHWRLPTFKDDISPEYKKFRTKLNLEYGMITLFLTLSIIFLQPLWNYLTLLIFRLKIISALKKSRLHNLIYHSNTLKVLSFWGGLSFLLCYLETFDDWMFISKRLGRVCCACFPALLFITLRPSPLPRILYLSLLPIHKWLSRIVVLEGLLHTIIYLFYFAHKNTMSKVKKLANVHGIVAMIGFAVIAISSLPKVRRSHFNFFYICHYIMTWVCVICLHFHARPGIGLYTIFNCLILGFQIIYRIRVTGVTKVSIIDISPSLVLLEFPLSDMVKKPSLPASHIRINNKNGNILKHLFYQIIPLAHPFTIASLPTENTVKLIIRRGKFPLKTNEDYYISGAYEPSLNFIKEDTIFSKMFQSKLSETHPLLTKNSPFMFDANRVLIVVGGSGISFGIPLLRVLNYNGIVCRLIWVSKDVQDLNLLNHFRGTQGIECYITGDVNEDDIMIDYYEDDKIENEVEPLNYGTIEDEVDFTTTLMPKKQAKQTLDDYDLSKHEDVNIDISDQCKHVSPKGSARPMPLKQIPQNTFMNIRLSKSIKVYYGRPNLGAEHYEWCVQSHCVGPSFRDGENVCCRDVGSDDVDKSKIWVVAAGPKGLVEHASEWASDGGLRCHTESFAV